MNGNERISAPLKGEPADMVPVMLHNYLMAVREYGITMPQFRDDPGGMAGAFIAAVEKYRYHGIMDTVMLAGAVGAPVDFPGEKAARISGGCRCLRTGL